VKNFGCLIYMTHFNEKLNLESWDIAYLKDKRYYSIEYTLNTYHLLPSPYSTSCFNYIEYDSQNDCLEKCQIRSNPKECVTLPVRFKTHAELRKFISHNLTNFCEKKIDKSIDCSEVCKKKDCVKNFYSPHVKVEDYYNESGNQIFISPSSVPLITYRTNPKLETIEFLCYMASIVGLWYGFSFLSVFFWFENLINWFTFNEYNIFQFNVFQKN